MRRWDWNVLEEGAKRTLACVVDFGWIAIRIAVCQARLGFRLAIPKGGKGNDGVRGPLRST